ncbi:hypothetical protein ACSBR2_039334 [Camellia fascicularis]
MQIAVNLVQETYEVQWPLSLVISRKAITKYQLILRFLFHYKHVDLQLCGAWQIHQGVRAVNTKGTAISWSSLLCCRMLKFINSLLHYLTFEVIEYHNFFLEKCIRECLLLLPKVLKGRKLGTRIIAAIQLSTKHNANIEAARHELKELHPNDPQIVVLNQVWSMESKRHYSDATLLST